MKYAVIVILFICGILFTHAYDGCSVNYGKRACNHRVLEGVLVTCDGRLQETKVPQNLPIDTVYMSLVSFRLGTLAKADFQKFSKVQCMAIINSGVNYVEQDAFSGMLALRELQIEKSNIDGTSLSFLNHESFFVERLAITESPKLKTVTIGPTASLNNLKSLVLRDNGITHIDRQLFEKMTKVEVLDFSNNNIEHLDWRVIADYSDNLNALLLHGNRIQAVPQSMSDVFQQVKKLTLAGNPFHCNCHMLWLATFYSVVFDKTLDYGEVTCTSPISGYFFDLHGSSFKCSDPAEPILQYSPLDDLRYEVNCSSISDPAPTLVLTLADGRSLHTPPARDISVLTTTTPQIVTTWGSVTCEAKNDRSSRVTEMSLDEIIPTVILELVTSGSSSLSWQMTWYTASITTVLML